MNKDYQPVLECPKCQQRISLQRKVATAPASEEITCICGWRGRARRARLLQVVPFNRVYSKGILAPH
jgi:hypothetical protein